MLNKTATQEAPAQGRRLEKRNAKGGTSFWHRLWSQRQLMLMLLPGLVYYIVFHYLPMYGLKLAFINYNHIQQYNSPWAGADGLDNFRRLFITRQDQFLGLLKNTLFLGVITFGTTFPLTIFFSLVLNEIRQTKMKKFYQTVSYLPTFLSSVIICSIFVELFSVKHGLVNKVLEFFGEEKINFMWYTWGYYLVYVLSGIWASLGNGAIIYLSALAGVDQEMYEAAQIDGCSRLKRIWHITLPSIMPTVVTMFLLNIGSLIKVGADKALLLQTPIVAEEADIFATFVYYNGINTVGLPQVSYTAAVGMFESVMCGILLITFNYIARKRNGTSIW